MTCALCEGRADHTCTRHHLVPREYIRQRRILGVDVKQTGVVWFCRLCHRLVHRLLSNSQLAEEYNTIERLRAHHLIKTELPWIRARNNAGWP